MASFIHQDKILVHCFQDCLTRAALSWYVNLESGHVKTWRDLVEAFIHQYKYNEDMAPDRSRLQNLSKTESEGFKDYAQRWRELAAQVQPPLSEKEMVTMFIDTLPSPFYDKAVGSMATNFADLVTVGERIESDIRRGKFAQTSSNTSFTKKMTGFETKRGETNAILVHLSNQSKIILSQKPRHPWTRHQCPREKTQASPVELGEVAMLGRVESHPSESLIIHYDPIHQPPTPLIIQVLARPAYKDDHVVPWQYDSYTENLPTEFIDDNSAKEVTNIAEAEGMTRSGRIYSP
ncbi:hypothetical protein CR513_21221, partial [Mucuna pruriens]